VRLLSIATNATILGQTQIKIKLAALLAINILKSKNYQSLPII